MALQVKSSLLQREKTILVAMDVAVRKMENLSMISMLCHHFSASRSSRNCWLEKLSSFLGKEAVDILEQLVSCQKTYNELKGHSQAVAFKGPTRIFLTSAEKKADLIHRLKESPEKRKFLKEIMAKTKVFLNLHNNDPARHKITEKNAVAEVPSSYSSVVNFLRAALKSKYRQHVLRCFKDLDVESLMNILYLVMPSSSTEHSAAKNVMYDDSEMSISPISSMIENNSILGHQVESNYREQSPLSSQGSLQSVFWDDEETVINFVEQLEVVEDHHQPFLDEKSYFQYSEVEEPSTWKQECESNVELALEVQEKFRRPVFSAYTPSNVKDNLALQLHNVRHDLEVIDLYGRFEGWLSTLHDDIIHQLLSTNEIYKDKTKANIKTDTINGVVNLINVFQLFRTLVLSMFAKNKPKDVGLQLKSFNRMAIDFQLLLIEEDKLKKMLNEGAAKHMDQRQHLDGLLLEWRLQVDEVRLQMNQKIRSSIKDHVAVEISIGKSRQNELHGLKRDFTKKNDSLSQTKTFVQKTVKSLRARRHYLEASLESLIREYDATMLKYQAKIDELSVEEIANNREIERLQDKFKVIEENYDEMRAMKRLKQLLQNMQKAEAIKQNWAARKIQVAWRKYKVAKLRKKKLKGRKKGKKKTPPPGKGTSPPTKSSTPGSRSKSQTP